MCWHIWVTYVLTLGTYPLSNCSESRSMLREQICWRLHWKKRGWVLERLKRRRWESSTKSDLQPTLLSNKRTSSRSSRFWCLTRRVWLGAATERVTPGWRLAVGCKWPLLSPNSSLVTCIHLAAQPSAIGETYSAASYSKTFFDLCVLWVNDASSWKLTEYLLPYGVNIGSDHQCYGYLLIKVDTKR